MKIARFAFSLAGVTVLSAPARAVEVVTVADEPVTVDVTNTAILNYHFDNRDGKEFRPATKVDDNYGEWLDRLNVQASYWRFRLGFRLDVATFFATTTRDEARDIATAEVQEANKQWMPGHPDPPTITDTASRFYQELQSRYLNTFYPAKLWIGYAQPGIDVTVGDFYTQLGRGLVLSIRKIDELGVDTTVRGAKAVLDHKFGPVRLAATFLGGQMNPVRVDEASGRRLHGEASPLFFAFPRQGDLVTYTLPAGGGTPIENVEPARPSYLADTVIGGRIEGGVDFVQLAVNGSMLLRTSHTEENLACANACPAMPPDARSQCISKCGAEYPDFSSLSAAQNHNTIRTFSGSVNLPNIAKTADVYVEVAGQQLRDGHLYVPQEQTEPTPQPDISGYAVYLSANIRKGPVTASLEGKHYRRFFPLAANIDTQTPGFSAPEYTGLSYNQPPTTEPIYVEPIESPNICITGGWGRTDYRFTREASVYAWLGYYVSHSEITANNNTCEPTPELRTNTWDTAVGADLDLRKTGTKLRTWIGGRVAARQIPVETDAGDFSDAFYQEGYIRYDIVQHLTGPFSLQFQGYHRRRYQVYKQDPEPWHEGENYTALQWSPHFAAIFGYEYKVRRPDIHDEKPTVSHYFSGGFQYRGSGESIWNEIFDTVTIFVGQRRGGTRCVSGVCRLFPPFEGAKLELVSRF